ncbi:hypothetical protein V6N12_032418 [Hibiscus sabdariffa]|uniref:Uncharacterized protein n=1 Tax=Hibiscus sabdariffa TaxID=183260 RepID=A0ABR2CCI6_9ROSI
MRSEDGDSNLQRRLITFIMFYTSKQVPSQAASGEIRQMYATREFQIFTIANHAFFCKNGQMQQWQCFLSSISTPWDPSRQSPFLHNCSAFAGTESKSFIHSFNMNLKGTRAPRALSRLQRLSSIFDK